MNKKVFITGGTGYIGKELIRSLLKNGIEVTALTRNISVSKIQSGCNVIYGNALDGNSYSGSIAPCETFIHLIGTHHPGPGKKEEFKKIDLVSIEEAVKAAVEAGVKHFVYLSVAHPAPVMKDFIEVRIKGEKLLMESGMNVSIIRPWYVLGPGHYWPCFILPLYKIFEINPFTRDSALRLGLVKLYQIIDCITFAVKNPPEGINIFNVQDIKKY